MKKEFEKRYLLTQEEITKLFDKKWPFSCLQIVQGYFWENDKQREYRIRVFKEDQELSQTKALLTIKDIPKNLFDDSINRDEFEVHLDPLEALYHLKNHCTKFLKKKRYLLQWNKNILLEINVFNERETIVEIEFLTEDDMYNYEPDFEYSMEVTRDRRYLSKNMADTFTKEELNDMLKCFEFDGIIQKS